MEMKTHRLLSATTNTLGLTPLLEAVSTNLPPRDLQSRQDSSLPLILPLILSLPLLLPLPLAFPLLLHRVVRELEKTILLLLVAEEDSSPFLPTGLHSARVPLSPSLQQMQAVPIQDRPGLAWPRSGIAVEVLAASIPFLEGGDS